jgi:hypothetical protein
MEERDVFIGVRTTPMERHAVQAYASVLGVTVSELIRRKVIEQAVRPLREAAQPTAAEVQDEQN